jgi:hypothetical protein
MSHEPRNPRNRCETPAPVWRSLQAFALDPSQEFELQSAHVNRAIIRVRWEEHLAPGPVGEYIEVVDIDPPSQCCYAPVDLNDPHLLATDGLSPSEGSPQFHQQMVYAVAMKTIANFEEALGRKIHWSPRLKYVGGSRRMYDEDYVPRLRIYPHALREANAYYSPHKKAVLFGYFNAHNADARDGLPGGIVFTCLSHDVIAHEMTHAILDGIHRRMLEPTNEDTLAFHEAFADLVAIFQHFTLPGVLEQQIGETRGDLARDNLLGKLAVEFGQATGRGNALRDVLGDEDESGVWRRHSPDPALIQRTSQPHSRGAILVAAVFDAFLAIYQARTEDLLRIAGGSPATATATNLPIDLVNRLADEARQVAQRLLTVSIRALDYLPPVDVNFGDFLRALITSHCDLLPDDPRHYRTAIIRAFRDRGIYPRDVRTLSIESLRWFQPSDADQELLAGLMPPIKALRLMTFAQDYAEPDDRARDDRGGEAEETVEQMTRRLLQTYVLAEPASGELSPDSGRPREKRRLEWQRSQQFARYWHGVLRRRAREMSPASQPLRDRIQQLLGIDLFDPDAKFEVHAVRPTVRIRQNGQTTYELLVLITQRRYQSLEIGPSGEDPLQFRFRSGCTLLIDPASGNVRYAVVKRNSSESRLERQKKFLQSRLQAEGWSARGLYGVTNQREVDASARVPQEPLRIVHGGCHGGEWT